MIPSDEYYFYEQLNHTHQNPGLPQSDKPEDHAFHHPEKWYNGNMFLHRDRAPTNSALSMLEFMLSN